MKLKETTRGRLERLVLLIAGGMAFFILLLASIQFFLYLSGHVLDPTIFDFYPLMAVLGAAFGAERWWAHEQGEYNPFHDK